LVSCRESVVKTISYAPCQENRDIGVMGRHGRRFVCRTTQTS
jgi:hypothetical protein